MKEDSPTLMSANFRKSDTMQSWLFFNGKQKCLSVPAVNIRKIFFDLSGWSGNVHQSIILRSVFLHIPIGGHTDARANPS